MKKTARPYQDKGMYLMRKAFSDGKRKILFWLATGGGKSFVFSELITGLMKNKKRILFLVKRKQLVFQTHRLMSNMGIDSSILIAAEKGFDNSKPLQICSIDTVVRRDMEFLKGFDAVIIDECHDATSKSYSNFLKMCQEDFAIPLYVGLTATPFPVNGRDHDFWDACVKPIEMHELRDQGFLVDCNLYIPSEVNLDDVKIMRSTGDYNEKQLSAKMQQLEVIGDAIEVYRKHGNNRPGLCFCVNIEHSKRMTLEFQRAGITAVHCDQATKQQDRDQAIKDLQSGKIKIICNVNIFSTGVDIPQAEVGIMARPTQSECLYIQQAGRLLRPYRLCGKCSSQYDNSPNCPMCGWDKPSYIKPHAVILDMGNNTSRFGRIFDVRYPAISDDIQPRKEREVSLIKTCKECAYVYDKKRSVCPMCGDAGIRERYHKTKDGELRPYDEYESIKHSFTKLQILTLQRGWKPNKKFFDLYKQYGEILMKYQKEFDVPKWIPDIYRKQQMEALNGKLYS